MVSLLDLPQEIRDKIWMIAFRNEPDSFCESNAAVFRRRIVFCKGYMGKPSSLLLVNKQVHADIRSLPLQALSKIRFHHQACLHSWMRKASADATQNLRRIVLDLDRELHLASYPPGGCADGVKESILASLKSRFEIVDFKSFHFRLSSPSTSTDWIYSGSRSMYIDEVPPRLFDEYVAYSLKAEIWVSQHSPLHSVEITRRQSWVPRGVFDQPNLGDIRKLPLLHHGRFLQSVLSRLVRKSFLQMGLLFWCMRNIFVNASNLTGGTPRWLRVNMPCQPTKRITAPCGSHQNCYRVEWSDGTIGCEKGGIFG